MDLTGAAATQANTWDTNRNGQLTAAEVLAHRHEIQAAIEAPPSGAGDLTTDEREQLRCLLSQAQALQSSPGGDVNAVLFQAPSGRRGTGALRAQVTGATATTGGTSAAATAGQPDGPTDSGADRAATGGIDPARYGIRPPGLDPQGYQQKLDKMARDAFMFYRATPALFYREYQNLPPQIQNSPRVANVHGDAHPDNFGTERGRGGNQVAGPNDLDEATGGGPIGYDIMRCMTGLVEGMQEPPSHDEALRAFLDGYRQGLAGDRRTESTYVRDQVESHQRASGQDKLRSEMVTTSTPPQLRESSSLQRLPADDPVRQQISRMLPGIVGRDGHAVTILDVGQAHAGGSSADLLKYTALIQVQGESQPRLVFLNQAASSVVPGAAPTEGASNQAARNYASSGTVSARGHEGGWPDMRDVQVEGQNVTLRVEVPDASNGEFKLRDVNDQLPSPNNPSGRTVPAAERLAYARDLGRMMAAAHARGCSPASPGNNATGQDCADYVARNRDALIAAAMQMQSRMHGHWEQFRREHPAPSSSGGSR